MRSVEPTEQLVSATDREERHSSLDLRPQDLPLGALKVLSRGNLLSVLSPAPEEEVTATRFERLPDPDFYHLRLDSSATTSLDQGQDIATVTVDVHRARIQPAYCQSHDVPPSLRPEFDRYTPSG